MRLTSLGSAVSLLLVPTLMALTSCGDEPRGPISDPALAELLAEVKKTNEALLRIEAKLGQSSIDRREFAASLTGQQSEPAWPADVLKQELGLMREEIAAISAAANRPTPPAPIPRQPPIPKRVDAVMAALERYKSSRDAERARCFLSTPAEMYAQYGTPDGVEPSTTGQIRWFYHVSLPENDWHGAIIFIFDGAMQVTGMEVE